MTQTYWLEPTMEARVGLRVYTHGDGGFDCEHGHHSAIVYTGRAPVTLTENGYESPLADPGEDAPWPTACSHCGTSLEGGQHQPWSLRIYRRTDTGEERFLHSNPDVNADDVMVAEPGACWNAWWMPSGNQPDGIYLMVRLPNMHDWAVDSRASNCGLPEDNEHHCWVRHGDPRECRVTVDKDGLTCNAGAGSIQGGDWHGFLRDGVLVQ